jgi:MFS superfamily sulfate permease-like transporter
LNQINFLFKKIPQLSDRVAQIIQDWSNDKDIINDPALSLIPSLYSELKQKGVDFKKDEQKVIF